MNCPKCGRPNGNGRRVCLYCGAPLGERIPCPGCGRPLLPGTPKCMYCGAQPPPAPPRVVERFTPDPGLAGEELMAAIGSRIDELARLGPADPQPITPFAEQVLNAAQAAWKQGRAEAALGQLESAIAREPQSARLHLLQGMILASRGQQPAAMAAIDRALAIDPKDFLGWFRKADLLDDLNRPAEALACYDRAVVLNPGFAAGWTDRGRALERLGRDGDALGSYARALEIDPAIAVAHNNRGACLLRQGEPEAALEGFRQAATLDPRLGAAWTNQALALAALKRPRAEIVECYRQALAADPGSFDAALKRAQGLTRQKQHEEALPLWEALVAARPEEPMLALQLRFARAALAPAQPADGPQGDLPQLLERARGYEGAREGDLAAQHYRAALALEPADRDALVGLARVLQGTSASEVALAAWEQALAHHPRDPEALCGRAEALADLKRFDEALAAAEGAQALEPAHGPAWLQAGRALLGLDRPAEAAAALERAVALAAGAGRAWLELGNARERLRQWPAAAAAWRRFLAIGQPAGFVVGIEKRSLPHAERLAGLLAEGAGWDAHGWAERGRTLAEAGEHEAAELCLAEALARRPGERMLLLRRAGLLGKLGRFDEAVAGLDPLLAANPVDRDALTLKGSLRFTQGQQAVAARNYGGGPDPAPLLLEAAQLLRHALALGADPALRQSVGMALFLAGRPEESQEQLAEAPPLPSGARLQVTGQGLGLTPPPPSPAGQQRYQEGVALLDEGKIEPAAKAFYQAVKLEPGLASAWNLLAMCLFRMGRTEDGLKTLDHAVARLPDHAVTWSNRANALSELGRHEEALASAERALRIDPQLHQAWGNRGRALAELGRMEEALAAFAEARRHGPLDPMHATNHALTLAKLGRLQEALPIAEQALALDPGHGLARQVYQAIKNDLAG